MCQETDTAHMKGIGRILGTDMKIFLEEIIPILLGTDHSVRTKMITEETNIQAPIIGKIILEMYPLIRNIDDYSRNR